MKNTMKVFGFGLIGLSGLIVGRTSADTTPPEIAALPAIGTHMRPSVELVLGLAPDLVLQMGSRHGTAETVRALRRLGVPTACFEASSFEGLFRLIGLVGLLTGEPERAQGLAGSLRARIERVREAANEAAARRGSRPRVLYEARWPDLLAAGRGSMAGAVLEAAGGANVLDAEKKFVRLGDEEVLRLNPEVWLLQVGPMNPNPLPPSERPHLAAVDAVRSGRVVVVDEQAFSRPGPRAVDAVELLCKLLYPGAKLPDPPAKK